MLPLSVLVGVTGNVLSVVGIVLTNKYITEVDGFDFMIFLSFLHFAFTAVCMYLLLYFDFFKFAPVSFSGAMPVAVGSLLSVSLMNLNLSHNSVGFYQLSKLACIPCTLGLQKVMHNTSTSKWVKLSLVPMTLGVGIATVYDVDVNFVGILFAACAVVATATSQIFTSTYQKGLDCHAMQLLYHTSPAIALGMLVMCPFFDDVGALMQFKYSYSVCCHIAISCCLSLGVNISNYLVLGKTSPVTYQVLGHMKTILVIVLGIVVFKKPVVVRNIIGVVVAMVGVISYTEVRRRETSSPVLPREGVR